MMGIGITLIGVSPMLLTIQLHSRINALENELADVIRQLKEKHDKNGE